MPTAAPAKFAPTEPDHETVGATESKASHAEHDGATVEERMQVSMRLLNRSRHNLRLCVPRYP